MYVVEFDPRMYGNILSRVYAKELTGKHCWLSREQAGLRHKGFTSTDGHVPEAAAGWAGTKCVLRMLLRLGNTLA